MNDQAPLILRVRNLKQYFVSGHGRSRYVTKAVDDVSFDIYKGEVFGLVGETGCGKTTTGRTIIKLYEPTDGDVYFLGKRIGAGTQGNRERISAKRRETREQIAALKEQARKDGVDVSEKILTIRQEAAEYVAREKEDIAQRKDANRLDYDLMRNMQMIFQDPIASLNPRMTVKEIVAEGLRIAGIRNDDVINEKVNAVLKTVGLLPEHASRYPHEFSGGQRQRIGIARAIIVAPQMLIADEPISALDVSIQAQVINLMNELRAKLGLTILFIAHDLSVIKYLSDRIGVMYFGHMVETASSEELFRNPFHPYTRSLLSAVPQPDPRHERNRVRITYNPATAHHYTATNQPTFREIKPGHWVLADDEEFARYLAEMK